jgi:hypothetical protein
MGKNKVSLVKGGRREREWERRANKPKLRSLSVGAWRIFSHTQRRLDIEEA